jgi:DNA polymerase III alpha subunit
MEISTVHSHKTILSDRTLWFDGDSSFEPSAIVSIISSCSSDGNDIKNIYVNVLTKEIQEYNRLVSDDEQILVKEEVRSLDVSWNIPEEYKLINVESYILDKFFKEINDNLWGDKNGKETPYFARRADRVSKELALFKKFQLFDVVKTLIYIINKFESENIVWGVGRGSSVSSYILYLIGVHDIDSVKFNLDVREFLHTS